MKIILQCDKVDIPNHLIEDKIAVLKANSLKECTNNIVTLWKSDVIKEAFEKRCEYWIQISSDADYYFDNAERFSDDNFEPTTEDLYSGKLKKKGVRDFVFKESGVQFALIDTREQSFDHRKWFRYFEDVVNIIFLASMDEYNDTSRLNESLRIFSELTDIYSIHPCVLFLNKSDLFEEKIIKEPLDNFFDDISKEDAKSLEASCTFIKNLYQQNFRGCKLYIYITCFIDTQTSATARKSIFTVARDSVLTNALKEAE